MKKKLSILIALVMAISLCMMPAVAMAADPGAPVIDGVASLTEWAGATTIPVAGGMGTVNVIAFSDYLYVLFTVQDLTDARVGQPVGNDKLSMNINPTLGAPWGMPCDIIFQTGTDPAAWQLPTCGQTDGYETDWQIDGVQQPLPANLVTKTIYSAGMRTSEWKIPLGAMAPPGSTLKVGGACDIDVANSGNSYRYPVGLDWGDVSTYVDIFVYGSSVVGVVADADQIIAISVSPASIDFGTVNPGESSGTEPIAVENIGTVKVGVTAMIDPTGKVFDHLQLDGGSVSGFGLANLVGGEIRSVGAQLVVPREYSAQGSETAVLIFIATP